jgi:hypothetical protein
MICPTCGIEHVECLFCKTKFAPKSGKHNFCTPLCGWRYKSKLPEEHLLDFKDFVKEEVRTRKGSILSAPRISRKILRAMNIEYNPNDNRWSLMVNDVFEREEGKIFRTTGKGNIYKFPPLKEREEE